MNKLGLLIFTVIIAITLTFWITLAFPCRFKLVHRPADAQIDTPAASSILVPDMKKYTAVVEHCPETNLFVGYVPGFPGAHSQGATLDELSRNLKEVLEMLLEDGEPRLEPEFVGIQTIEVAPA